MSSDEDTGYNAGQKLDLQTIQQMDADDVSLQKYKAALLGNALDANCSPADDPRRVVIKSMSLIFENRPGGDIVYKFDTQADVEAMKNKPFVLREGCAYKIKVEFKIQHEIVSGLKYVNQVYRSGIRAVKELEMLGSFAPQAAPHSLTFPKQGWEEAPKGALARGKYTAKSKFVDDDKQVHLRYEYSFQIKKDWV